MGLRENIFWDYRSMSTCVYLQNVGQLFSLATYFAHIKTLKNQTNNSHSGLIVLCAWASTDGEIRLLNSICKKVFTEIEIREIPLKQRKIISSPFRTIESKKRAWRTVAPSSPHKIVFGHQLNSSRDTYSLLKTFPEATALSFGDNGTFYDWSYFQAKNTRSTLALRPLFSRTLRSILFHFFETETSDYVGFSPAPKFFGTLVPKLATVTRESIINFFEDPFDAKVVKSNIGFGDKSLVVLLPNFANSGLMTRDVELELVKDCLQCASIDGHEIWYAQHPNSKTPWQYSEIEQMGIPNAEARDMRLASGLGSAPIEFIARFLPGKTRFLSFSAASMNLSMLGLEVEHGLTNKKLRELAELHQIPAWMLEQNLHYLEVLSEIRGGEQ
jgi:hypothetical protein